MNRRILLVLAVISLILLMVSCNNPEKEFLKVEEQIQGIKARDISTKEEYDASFNEQIEILEKFIEKYPDYERTEEFKDDIVSLKYNRVLYHIDRIRKSKPTSQEEGEKLLKEWKDLLISFIQEYPGHKKSQELRFELKQLHSMLQELPEALQVLEDIIKYNEDEKLKERLLVEKIVLLDADLKQEYTEDKEKTLKAQIKNYRDGYKDGQYNDFIVAVERTIDLRPGGQILEFKTKDTKEKDFSFKQYEGKVVLLDFWASWCQPCKIEMPNVIDVYNKYHSKGFEIVGVSLDKDLDAMNEYIKENKMTWRQIADGEGWNSEFAIFYNIKSIPATFLIDRNGVIRYTNLRGEELEKAVEELIKEKAK